MSAERCADIDEALRKRLHDLRSPLITMRGFGDELSDAVARLTALAEAHQGALPEEYLAATRDLLERDVGPCLGFLQSSVKRLGNVVDDMSSELAPESDT
ncbi:MAG: hypothetical protein KJO82_06210 [Gammaproteobacteria bacterium]|nr:hypothetical protein [Gammaproteobacteria bacterium]